MNQQNQHRDSRQYDAEYYRRRQRQYEQYLYESTLTDEEREARRRGREEARRLRQRAKRARQARRILPPVILTVVLLAMGIGSVFLVRTLWKNLVRERPETEQTDLSLPASGTPEVPEEPVVPEEEPEPVIAFRTTPATVTLPDKIIPSPEATSEEDASSSEEDQPEDPLNSAYAILIDLDEGTVLVQRNAQKVIHPASMTKILTVLVAAEHITNYNTTATVTQETLDYCVENNCSIAGFTVDEEVSIMDLFYGTILPSGADAAVTLANYAAGSHEAFVELMNEKAEQLGIAETAHFANCVGLFDERNVCTVYDMAVILNAAMENPLCRQVLGLRIHDIPASELHPEGITLSNWFIRRIEDHMPEGVVVRGAKTGFISEAGSCAASLAQDSAGRSCLCVTAMAGSAWQCIFDHVALYETYGFNALT